MTSAEPAWSALKSVVGEALDLPAGARDAYLEMQCPDPARRTEATRLLRSCEQAAASPVLELPAAQFVAPVLAEVHERESEIPEALRAALAGRYTIEQELGRGGMATVYLARDERHGRPVALKLLRPELVPGDGPAPAAARFHREIQFAARLSHPHILPLYDSGEAGGLLYYITPYVDGETLRDRLRRGRLPISEALRLLRYVARALAYAHRQGLVHRDIKPANILLNQEGDALVADFGVAKALAAAQGVEEMPEAERAVGPLAHQSPAGSTQAELTDGTLVLGTPAYMAPEQVTGGRGIDQRADLYAFGAVAYELLTGAAPFAGRPQHELLAAHLSEVPEPVAVRQPNVPEPLAALVDRLLAKHPDDRPRDATEVLQILDAAVAGPALAAREAGETGGSEGGAEDREAYELYRKGRYLVGTRQRDGLLRALAYFEAAVARDSTHARAYAGIADVWTFLGIFGHAPPRDAFPRARAAAERAISLDSRLVEGHAALAHLLFVYEWNWPAAETALQRAIALNPRYPLVRMYYASFLTCVGRPDEALAQLTIAKELDPLIQIGLLSGRVYVTTHRPDEAIRVLEEEIELDPRRDLAHQLLAHAYLQRGMPEEAIASMKRAAALSGARDSAQLAYIYARTGHHAEARRLLARLKEDGQLLDYLGYHVAMAYAGLDDSDEAFHWLEAGYEHRCGFMCLLAVETGFESLGSDPRFDDLVRRMGLRQPLDAAVGGPAQAVGEVLRDEVSGIRLDERAGPLRIFRSALVGLRRRLLWRTSIIGTAALLAVAAGAMLARSRVTARTVPVRIAVLPFDALGDSSATNYLATGLSDGIGTDLARLRRVVAPGYVTTSAYRESTKSLKQIGSELQVGAVLRGSVQRFDGRVRVDAELLDPETGKRLWARRYERPTSEILEVQRDIERRALAKLRIRPTAGERESLDRPATTNDRAYDLYLRGRAVELAGQSRELFRAVPADNIRRAQSLYSQALNFDPRFAAARARLALMHTLAAATYDSTEARREQARLEAEAALRLSPGLPEAHEALASYWDLKGEVAKAIDELGRALESFPHSADLHLALGSMLREAGRLDDAVAEFDHATRLEPGNPKGYFAAGLTYGRLRRPEEAKRMYDRAIAVAPDYHMVKVIKGQAYLRWTGIPDTLSAAMESVPADWDPDGMATYGRYTALWVQRRHAHALAMLDSSRSELSHDPHVYQPISLMRARLQEALGEWKMARASYATARSVLQDSVDAHPSDPNIRVSLGMAYAGLGRTAEAVREARRAMELVNPASDTPRATAIMGGAVEVFASAGEFDAAFDLLELLFSMPAGREVTVPFLRVWPGFDPLRSDPRFDELLARFETAP